MATFRFFLSFNPTDMLRVCVRKKYVLVWCSMIHSLYFVMQHDHALKKFILPFDPTPMVRGEGSADKI